VLPRSEELGDRICCVALHPLMSDDLNEYIAAAAIEAVERVRAE
jgi:hypothetical protein